MSREDIPDVITLYSPDGRPQVTFIGPSIEEVLALADGYTRQCLMAEAMNEQIRGETEQYD